MTFFSQKKYSKYKIGVIYKGGTKKYIDSLTVKHKDLFISRLKIVSKIMRFFYLFIFLLKHLSHNLRSPDLDYSLDLFGF